MSKTVKEKAGMVMACVSMLGVETKGEFMDILQFILNNESDYFTPAKQETKENNL